MERYYVSIKTELNPSGKNELHLVSCKNLPSMSNRIFIGYHSNPEVAKKEAEKYFPGNVLCCKECLEEWRVKSDE